MAKDELRQRWDELVYESAYDELTETCFTATRLFPFFYDQRIDSKRAVELLRWLVQSEDVVKTWLQTKQDFSWVLIRLGMMMLKSVGLSEYNPIPGYSDN